MGVEPYQLKSILETKLLMDGRRASSFNVQKKGQELNHSDWALSFMYLLFGAFGLAAIYSFGGEYSGFVAFYSLWIILLLITLITDFTDVLIDVRDNYIILPTPISGRTLALSRTLHLVIYLSALIIPFVLPSLIYVIITKGLLFSLVFLVQFIFALLFTIFLVNVIYLLLLNFTSGQKFKDIINYFQIGFSVFIFSCYYLLPRLIDVSALKSFDVLEKWWVWALPGSYFAAPSSMLVNGGYSNKLLVLSVLSIILTFGGIYLVTTVLSKNFEQKLLNIDIKGDSDKKKVIQEGGDNIYMSKWNALINQDPIEKVGFKMSWLMTARNRMYKLRTYPIFGMIPAFFIYFAMDGDGSPSERFESMRNGNSDITLLYFALFAVITPLANTKFSDVHKAASIFKALPIKSPGLIIRGNCKAIIIKYGLPTFLIIAIAVIIIFGIESWVNILVAAVNAPMVLFFMALTIEKSMPFSQSWEDQAKGSNTYTMFGVMFLIGLIGLGHYLLRDQTLWLVFYSFCSLIITFFIAKKLGQLSWRDVI